MNRIAHFVLAAALLTSATAQTISTGKTVRRHKVAEEGAEVARAEAALEKNDYAAAERALQEALARDPNDYRALFNLGYLYTATGRRAEAIEAYRKSVVAKPDVFESNLNLGLTLAQSGNPEGEKYLRAATQLKPTARPDEGLFRAWLSLGRVIEGRDRTGALQAYAEAAKLQPKSPEPHIAAAQIYEQQSELAAAEKEYQLVLQLDGKSSDALGGLANVYLASKRLTEAENALRKLVALDPQNGPAHIQLGRVLAASGKPDDAIAELQTGLRLGPENAVAQRELAQVYTAAKKYGEAAAQYRALLQQSPDDAELHHGLGTALLRQRKYAEAESELLIAVELKPDSGQAYSDLAIAASENRHYQLAIRALDARAKFLPELPATYFLRATAHDHLQDRRRAAENYHRFLKVANGQFPDQEWQARHRLIAIEPSKK
jgi:tetratricopeptide (TPR) repeat protein